MTKRSLVFLFALLFSFNAFASTPKPFGERRDVQKFINMMVKDYHFNHQKLTVLFNTVKPRPRVIQKITHPYEKEHPWSEYKTHFVNKTHIQHGVEFWKKNKKALAKAEKIYGVPAYIIVAIIGIETDYGRHMGDFPVLDALSNIAFERSTRSAFFQRELVQFLLLCREKNIDPRKALGSYAGAMGLPQFMPGTLRYYAVDFNHTGKIDITHSEADAIGSIANFFKVLGWKTNQPIVMHAKLKDKIKKKLQENILEANFTIAKLKYYGIYPSHKVSKNKKVGLIKVNANGGGYFIGFSNLYVITHYNNSILYALAAYQLGQEIQKAMKNSHIK